MNFKIDLKIFIFIILYYFTKQIKIYSIIMIFCMLHEFGHLLAGLIVKMKPSQIKIMPFGFSISFKTDIDAYNYKILNGNLIAIKKIFVALAGPLTNAILILVIYNMDINYLDKQMMIFANLIILIFNMLPIYPLDGGRVLKEILHIAIGIKKAKIYSNEISIFISIFITIISSIAIYYFKNIAILFIVIFLWGLVINENRKFRLNMKLYENIEKYKSIEKEEQLNYEKTIVE